MAKIKESLEQIEKQREDLGFGTNVTSDKARLVKANGNFNVRKLHQSYIADLNIYHRLIKMHWFKFILLILGFYFLLNVLFGLLYYFIGIENLAGINSADELSDFWEAFYFSSQTLTTVGYGRISPTGYLTSFVAAIEALIGLLTFALMTGLIYGRFSRPNPKIIYSKNILMAPYLDINGLMFRMANEKSNQLINVSASVIFSKNEMDNGKKVRRYYTLELERRKVKFFATAWTVVHPINKASVLYHETEESLRNCDAEFIISVEGTNDTMTDPVHSRVSYAHEDVVWGAKFVRILETDDHEYVLDLSKISTFDNVPLNTKIK